MSEGHMSQQGASAERRSGDRQISVLINAGIVRGGQDSLCRIRNLSSGGVMIECPLPLAVDDQVSLWLRSGHELDGQVRWVQDDKAGIAFDEPGSAALITTARGVSGTVPSSPIGYPLFRRNAWARLAGGHRRERAAIIMISPSGIVVDTMRDWSDERVLTVTIDGLGAYMARRNEAFAGGEEDGMALSFVQPLPYRAFCDWLSAMPSAGEALPVAAMRPEGACWL